MVKDNGKPTEIEAKDAAPFQYGKVSYWLTVVVIILAVVVVAVTGTIRMMVQADAHTALGYAKNLRIGLVVLSTEAYAAGRPFTDSTRPGGVAEGLYQEVLLLTTVPGDFQLYQTGENGYGVEHLVYTEWNITVEYRAHPVSWTVTLNVPLIFAEPGAGEQRTYKEE